MVSIGFCRPGHRVWIFSVGLVDYLLVAWDLTPERKVGRSALFTLRAWLGTLKHKVLAWVLRTWSLWEENNGEFFVWMQCQIRMTLIGSTRNLLICTPTLCIELHSWAQNLENGNLFEMSADCGLHWSYYIVPFASQGNNSPIVPILVSLFLHFGRKRYGTHDAIAKFLI